MTEFQQYILCTNDYQPMTDLLIRRHGNLVEIVGHPLVHLTTNEARKAVKILQDVIDGIEPENAANAHFDALPLMPESPPRRQYQLILKMQADTRHDLVGALMNFATMVDRQEITVGSSGGVNSGWIYELLIDPAQTHESYFQQLSDYLEKKQID